MLTRSAPLDWRQGFALHRRTQTTDCYGDPVDVYDMEHPDFTAQDGSPDGICWQSMGSAPTTFWKGSCTAT